MSRQSQIIEDIEKLVMKILENGSVSEEEGIAIDTLEEKLYQENAFVKGEAVANLFFENKIQEGVAKLIEEKITPKDFFGFIDYHYDEEHPDEGKIGIFTESFVSDINKQYADNC